MRHSPAPAIALALTLGSLCLAGCANWRGSQKTGITETQAAQDMTDCRHSAEIYDRGIIPPLFPDPNTKARVRLDNKVYRACMRERGYTDIGWSPFREWKPSAD